MPTPHPSAAGGAPAALLFPLLAGQIFHLVFSNKTKHDGLRLDVREKLVGAGLNVWQQKIKLLEVLQMDANLQAMVKAGLFRWDDIVKDNDGIVEEVVRI